MTSKHRHPTSHSPEEHTHGAAQGGTRSTSRRPMQPCPDAWLRLVLAKPDLRITHGDEGARQIAALCTAMISVRRRAVSGMLCRAVGHFDKYNPLGRAR